MYYGYGAALDRSRASFLEEGVDKMVDRRNKGLNVMSQKSPSSQSSALNLVGMLCTLKVHGWVWLMKTMTVKALSLSDKNNLYFSSISVTRHSSKGQHVPWPKHKHPSLFCRWRNQGREQGERMKVL